MDKLLPAHRAHVARPSCNSEPNPVVCEFPLDPATLYNCFDKDSPLPSDSDWDDDARSLTVKRIMVALDYLEEQCGEIWSGYRKIHFSWAYVNKRQGLVVHFGKCLRRDDSLIRNGDQLEQLKEILAKDGLKEEPGWFVSTH